MRLNILTDIATVEYSCATNNSAGRTTEKTKTMIEPVTGTCSKKLNHCHTCQLYEHIRAEIRLTGLHRLNDS